MCLVDFNIGRKVLAGETLGIVSMPSTDNTAGSIKPSLNTMCKCYRLMPVVKC